MKWPITNRQFVLMSLVVVLMAFAMPGLGYAQGNSPSVTASTASPLTEGSLDGSVVTLTLSGGAYASSIFDVRRGVSVSGIPGVSVGTFGITRVNDTKLTIELDFNGDFDEDETLTFTVGAGAIANYSGAALTAELSVSAAIESVTASTTSPLTEATLDGSVVTLTLAGRAYASSIFDVRDGVSVSGIAGVSVGTFGVTRLSDTKVTVELDFNGDIDSDGTLTFTVGADAIADYNGAALTAELSVSAGMESVTASTTSPLTESTLHGSVVTLTLSGGRYASSIFDVRDGVSVSGIAGVSVGTFGVTRLSDTKVTVELDFNGDIDSNGTLTFTVGADALANYSGPALTDQLPVTASMESVTATTASPLTEGTLNGSVVTLTLSGGRYASSIFDVRDGVSVSGVAGVSVGTFGVTRLSDTKVTIELSFNGDIDSNGTLTFTVGADALANYSGPALTDQLPVTASMESVTATTVSPLTEGTLNGSVVTLTLSGGRYASSIFDVRDGVSVSGVAGVSVGTFGVRRVSDTKVTVELTFNGDIDSNGTLTFTVGADALANYSGPALTDQLPVTASMESVTATTVSPLTEGTLDGSVVTLTLSGARYASSIFDVRDGVSVSGVAGVSVGTFGVQRVSDTKVTVELDFNGDIDSNGTLTFTVGADALANYSGPALTDQLPVTASMESVTATTTSPLTEGTLDGSVVTLTLSGAKYARSTFDVRDGVSVSGVAGVSVGTFGVQRVSDTKVTVELTFNGDIDSNGTLTFTVGADALANYSGPALTDQVSVTALEETVVATTPQSLTEATLNGSVVTLTLSGRSYASSIFDVRRAVTVSGIMGVSVGTFGIQRASDTKVTVTLTYNGDIDADGTLTFTVGAGAISNYSGAALTAQLPVSAGMESVTATTVSPLTEATLNGSVVTLTLTGGAYESSIHVVRRGVSVSGITGVSVGTFGIQRVSDTKVTVELTFNGDIDADGTLTFTVGAGAIASYSGAALTAQLPVSAGMESVTATTVSPLTEATLNGSVVTLTLSGGAYESSIHVVRRGVSVSGITDVSVEWNGVDRISDTKVTVELSFSGDIDADGSLTFTVGAGAIANYSGPSLTDHVSVTALEETVIATVPQLLTEATLNGSVVTLTLSGCAYVSSTHDVRDGVSVSGIAGVSVGEQNVDRISDTKVTVELSFSGNIDNDGRLTFTVGAGAIANYSGEPLVASLPVTAEAGGGTNQVPTFSAGSHATRSFAENTGAGQNIGSPVGATDSDGGTLTYSLEGTNAASFTLVSTSGQLQTKAGVNYDYEVKNRYEVTVRVSDGQGGSTTIDVTVNLTDVSEPQPNPELYWTDLSEDRIQRADLDGSNVEDLITSGLDGPVGLALDVAAGKMYWTEWERNKIRRANLDGSGAEDLITSGRAPVWLALDVPGGKIYWTDWGRDRIRRADLDGSNVEDLVTTGLNSPAGLVLDVPGGKMYWTDSSEDKIQRANLDGSNVEDLITSGLGSPSGLALDVASGKMYWTDRERGEIRRADLSGANIEDVITRGLNKPYEVDLDLAAGKMYWTDLDTDKIQRANLDGSNVEDLVTRADGLEDPSGLALAVAAAPTPPAPQGPCATGSAVPNPAANPWLVSDCNALLDARDTLAGTATLNWSENTLISTWDGVTLSGTPQRVTNLRLWNESLNGTIPAELSRLTGLKALYLAFNQLTGTIPAELGTMTGLTHLGLMNNRLTGQIPAELRNLTDLRQFALQNNQLTGTIPAWLGSLPQLRILNLQGNRMTGPIPAELGRLSELWQLLIFGNQLTGTIPAELGNLNLLQEVRLDDNQLTGSIPSSFSSLTKLTLLYLAGNTLTGCIPVVLRDVSSNDLDKLNLPDCTGSQGQVTADFNGDGIVNFADFFDFVDAFGTTDAKFDLDGSGTVDFADFFEFVDAFGTSG